ncbi:InlB B-repeat-containing protein [Fusibacter paucivorans]|uniref:InlB B-repeat-containing protein n=1 Tax=Fusibacter paucivorans TaxID=76009 RepID=A0ABS5PT36_9FIRM|nr:InlB B-repeat-containing protein [Fusibacter paucivorans]MBS7528330.1 InlB B-repeat-containing protein [Fusibacter paucivorans]
MFELIRKHQREYIKTAFAYRVTMYVVIMTLMLMSVSSMETLGFAGTDTGTGSTWVPVGEKGFTTDSPSNSKLYNFDDTLYISYVSSKTDFISLTTTYKGHIMKYGEATGWIDACTPFEIGDPNFEVAMYDHSLYAAYTVKEIDNTYSGVLKKLTPEGTWLSVGDKFVNVKQFRDITIDITSGTPYLFYNTLEEGSTHVKGTVKRYTDSDGWTQVGNQLADYHYVSNMAIIVGNGIPYIAYSEDHDMTGNESDYRGTVKQYSEANGWVTLGSSYFDKGWAQSINLKMSDGKLYMAYFLYGDNEQTGYVEYYENGDWHLLDSSFQESGSMQSLNFDIYDQVPYIAFNTSQKNVTPSGVTWTYTAYIAKYSEANGWEAIDTTNIAEDGFSQFKFLRMGGDSYVLYIDSSANYKPTVMKQVTGQTATDHTVSFNVLGGSAIDSQTVAYQGAVTKPADPTKTGFSFGGWYSDGAYKNAWDFDADTMPDSDLTLYAKWVEIQTYTVAYDGNGNTGGDVPTDTGAYAAGADVTVAGNTGGLEKTGYTFAGWNTQADGKGTDYAGASSYTMGTANATLYAKWTANSTDSSWETVGSSNITFNGMVRNQELFYVNNTLYATVFSENIDIFSEGHYLYLLRYSASNDWEIVGAPVSMATAQYTVAVNDNDIYIACTEGSGSNRKGVVKKLKQDDSWEQVGSTPFHDGNNAVIMSMDVSTGIPYIFYTLNGEDKSVVKKYTETNGWQQVGDAFTNVQFVTTSIALHVGVPYIAYGSRIGLSDECDGITMKYSETNGWETMGSFNGGDTISRTYSKLLFYQDVPIVAYNRPIGDDYQVAADVYRNGAWQKIDPSAIAQAYGIRDTHFSNAINGPYLFYAVIDYVNGNTVYSKYLKHYTENGWEAVDTSDLTDKTITMLSHIKVDNTHYAAFIASGKLVVKKHTAQTVSDHTVSFNVLGGSAIDSQTVAHQGTVTKPADPTKTGFSFGGWYSDGAYKNAWDFDADTMPDNDLTLYAKWVEIQTYTVTYDGNGNTDGDVPTDTGAYAAGADVTVAGNTGGLEKTGYTFAGWNTQADGKGTDYADASSYTIGTDDVTFYAKWTANQLNDDSELKSLTVTGYALDQPFDADTLSYTISHVTAATVDILPIASDSSFAEVTVNGTAVNAQSPVKVSLQNGANVVNIVVMAQDKVSKTTYTVTINKDSDLANLASLSVVDYSISPAFDKDTTNYQVNITTSGSLLVVVVPEKGATVDLSAYNMTTSSMINVTTGSSLKASTVKVTPAYGTTQYPFAVTAQNGIDKKTYMLTVINKDDTAVLKTLTLGNETKTPSAQQNQVNYQLANTTNNSIDVTPTALSERIQQITINGTVVNSGDVTNVPLAMGNNTITIIVTAEDGATTATYTVEIARVAPDNNDDTGSTRTNRDNDNTQGEDAVEVIINGEVQNIGTEKTDTVDGKLTTTISVDKTALKAKLDEATVNGNEGKNTFVVPVKNTSSTAVKTQLTGDMVKAMEDAAFELTVSANDIDYTLPAKEVNISSVASALEIDEANLESIVVDITIDKLDQETSDAIVNQAETGDLEIVYPPVSFTVEATVTTTDGTQRKVDVTKFSSYVSRKIAIPEGVDPSKITTGVVYNEDGTFSHVPTNVILENGTYYAIINSATNSSYSVVYHHITVESVKGHWSEAIVNNLASRMVIEDPENFKPDDAITRGDFVTYLTKGLGIYRTNSADLTLFSDMAQGGDANALTIAAQYGIIGGYEDGTVRPNASITREEAMVMLTQAMDALALLQDVEAAPVTFGDIDMVSDWAVFAVNRVTSHHIFNGMDEQLLSPKSTFTYAQAAATIDNLLVKAALINE